jgi:hypothetical protein
MPAVGELCCRAAFERRHPLRLSSVPLCVELAYPVSSTSVGHLMPVELPFNFLNGSTNMYRESTRIVICAMPTAADGDAGYVKMVCPWRELDAIE